MGLAAELRAKQRATGGGVTLSQQLRAECPYGLAKQAKLKADFKFLPERINKSSLTPILWASLNEEEKQKIKENPGNWFFTSGSERVFLKLYIG